MFSIFQNLIFPHIHGVHKNPKKEVSFVHCYNFILADYRKFNDAEFNSYLSSIDSFINNAKTFGLVQDERIHKGINRNIKDQIFNQGGGNSAMFFVKLIEPAEKKKMDEYLVRTGYNKPLDKYSHIYEGCVNDTKLYLGGKKEMMVSYCRLFPRATVCKDLYKKNAEARSDKVFNMFFGEADRTDKILDDVMKAFDKAEEDINQK